MVKTCTAPPLALNIFDLISTINKVLYNKPNYTCSKSQYVYDRPTHLHTRSHFKKFGPA